MQSKLLSRIAESASGQEMLDKNSPLSFKQWRQTKTSIPENNLFGLYIKYVLEWFNTNRGKTPVRLFVLRQKYLYMLSQLQLFFTEEEKNVWYNKINVADEKELLLGIPFFARKLKNVALYYYNLRKKIKTVKLRYNTVGTNNAIETELYNAFLQNYNNTNLEFGSEIVSSLPSPTNLKNNLSIKIDELYDDKTYLDRSNTLPVSSYFDLFHPITEEFFQTKGIVLSSDEFVFNSLTLPVTGDFGTFFDEISGNIFETTDEELYTSFIEKFLGENRFNAQFPTPGIIVENYQINLSDGSNSFYYPYGKDKNLFNPNNILFPIALSSIEIEGATASVDILSSDTLFVRYGDTVKGAWLYLKEYEETNEIVKAYIFPNNKTTFLFPYPGFGLSAADLSWTGYSFETDPEYQFLADDIKTEVNKAYWSSLNQEDSLKPILLNNASVLSLDVTPNRNPLLSDQVFVKEIEDLDLQSPAKNDKGAWLYRFERASIPISSLTDNVIFWPYQKLNPNEPFPQYIKELDIQDTCDPISVNLLDKSKFNASSEFDFADRIYKLNNYTDTFDLACECIWLSSQTFEADNKIINEQDGFNILCEAGEYTKFVWTGDDSTVLSNVFRSISHSTDCPFITNRPQVSSLDWQKCSCKQVYYSPFGHSGRSFEEYNQHTDFIVEELSGVEDDTFNIGTWQDENGNSFTNSAKAAWFKTNVQTGWGDGEWSSTAAQTEPFALQKGKTYIYYRANTKTNEETFPLYSVNYKYNTNKTKWAQARKLEDGTWVNNDTDSFMNLHPGDLLLIERQPSSTYFLLSTIQIENESENISSAWSSLDKVALQPIQSTIFISWPDDIDPFNANQDQYPSVLFLELSSPEFYWEIKNDQTNQIFRFNQPFITFTPDVVGTYSISVTAIETRIPILSTTVVDLTGIIIDNEWELYPNGSVPVNEIIFSEIPSITAIPEFSDGQVAVPRTTTLNGFVLEQLLRGWNYNQNTKSINSIGAKPYWAELFTNKDNNTNHKKFYTWGYSRDFEDGYLPTNSPKLSPLLLEYGTVIEYDRKGPGFVWQQPIEFKKFINIPQWSLLSATVTDFSNLAELYSTERKPTLLAVETLCATDILLSNYIDGKPLEVFYNAINSFTWNLSVETGISQESASIETKFLNSAPWNQITNRFYPTIATVPTLEKVYSIDDVGGYFLPQNLGASQYINKDFTAILKTKELTGNFLIENTLTHIGGRGLTKQDQDTVYSWLENNEWLKENSSLQNLAGAPKKQLTKTLQTFIPYQNNVEEKAFGIISSSDGLTPWTGEFVDEWGDKSLEPTNFTGVRNVSRWSEAQISTQKNKIVNNWVSDIFGNQYGLFKEAKYDSLNDLKTSYGELWVKNNAQQIFPAFVALSSIFESYKNEPFYSELTNQGIVSVDCFYNTLMLETSGALLFVEIQYDYRSQKIQTVFDNNRTFIINSSTIQFDQTWFFDDSKKVICLFTEKNENRFLPTIFEYDLDLQNFVKVFPNKLFTYAIESQLSSVSFENLSRGHLYYNNDLENYLVSYSGIDEYRKPFIVSFKLAGKQNLELVQVDTFRDFGLINQEPPLVDQSFLIPIEVAVGQLFEISPIFYNEPIDFELINYTNQITFTAPGVFQGILAEQGYHFINYRVSNSIGSIKYCLILNVT